MSIVLYRQYSDIPSRIPVKSSLISFMSSQFTTMSRNNVVNKILDNYDIKIQHTNGNMKTLCGDIPYTYTTSLLYDNSKTLIIVIDHKENIVGFAIFNLNYDNVFVDLLCSVGYGNLILSSVCDMAKVVYKQPRILLNSLKSSLSFYIKYGFKFSKFKYYVKDKISKTETLLELDNEEIPNYINNDNYKLFIHDTINDKIRDEEYRLELIMI